MSEVIVERKSLRKAIQWTGSNAEEVEAMLESIGLTSVSSSVDGTDLDVTWSGGSMTLEENNWALQSANGETLSASAMADGTFRGSFNVVYP